MLLLAGAVTSCAHKAPKPPVIRLYLNDAESGLAYCSRSDGHRCPSVNIGNTDKWYLLQPDDWQSVQDYVDLLVCIVDGSCKGQMSPNSVSVRAEDLKTFSHELKKIKQSLEIQRNE